MKRYFLIMFLLIAAEASAADKAYYSYPDATSLPDTARFLVYDTTLVASKNITAAKLKSEVLGGTGALIKAAPTGAADSSSQFVVKNATGTVTMCVTASGTVVIGGDCP